MIQQLLGDNTSINMLERMMNFTEQRHQLLLADIANVSTPGYVQQDVSVADFQKSLQDAVDSRTSNPSAEPQSTSTVEFAPHSSSLRLHPKDVVAGTPFHDRGVRSMESLMSNLADNAQVHNMAAQLLKSRYDLVTKAINLKP